jgi:hypothetical protein
VCVHAIAPRHPPDGLRRPGDAQALRLDQLRRRFRVTHPGDAADPGRQGDSLVNDATIRMPGGVGAARKPPVYMRPGDVFEVEIEGIGVLGNVVQDE